MRAPGAADGPLPRAEPTWKEANRGTIERLGAVAGRASPLLGGRAEHERPQFLGRVAGDDLELAAFLQQLDQALQDELADYLAQIFAWIIALVRPDHISLAGTISDMGTSLLDCAVDKTRALISPDLMQTITFSQDNSENLVALGAVARTLQQELGLI